MDISTAKGRAALRALATANDPSRCTCDEAEELEAIPYEHSQRCAFYLGFIAFSDAITPDLLLALVDQVEQARPAPAALKPAPRDVPSDCSCWVRNVHAAYCPVSTRQNGAARAAR